MVDSHRTYPSQPGQTSVNDVMKRDLRAELLIAEQEARNKKRKAEGKPPLPVEDVPANDEANKRRKVLQEALELDKDDDEDEDDRNEDKEGKANEDGDGGEYV